MTDDHTPFLQKPALRVARIVVGVVLLIPGLFMSYFGIELIGEGNKHSDGGILIIMGLVALAPGVVLVLIGLPIVISAARRKKNTRQV